MEWAIFFNFLPHANSVHYCAEVALNPLTRNWVQFSTQVLSRKENRFFLPHSQCVIIRSHLFAPFCSPFDTFPSVYDFHRPPIFYDVFFLPLFFRATFTLTFFITQFYNSPLSSVFFVTFVGLSYIFCSHFPWTSSLVLSCSHCDTVGSRRTHIFRSFKQIFHRPFHGAQFGAFL